MIEKLVQQYSEAKDAIFSAFDVEDAWEAILIYPDQKYEKYENILTYWENNIEHGFESASLIGEKDGWELFSVSDNGDEFFALFQIKNRRT